MKLRRLIYLGYYVTKMDWPLLFKFFRYARDKKDTGYLSLLLDSLNSIFRYNISLLEYFQFRFFDKDHLERLEWAGTGFMYETIKILNPEKERYKLRDKRFFLRYYSQFVKHRFITIDELKKGSRFDFSEKIVVKNSEGQCGRGIEIVDVKEFNNDSLHRRLIQGKNDMVEEYIYQHDKLRSLAPSGLNTLRVFTTLNSKNEVDIIGVRLRISINSIVDNLAAGNLAAPVDVKTGVVTGPGVYSDITKAPEIVHPTTKESIVGFKIPYYEEAIVLVKEAALYDKGNRSIGWDVAISNNGPSLIEGNHDWCKLLWQLPVKEGLKSEIEKFK